MLEWCTSRRTPRELWLCMGLVACGATEGALLERRPVEADAGGRPALRVDMSLQYQITGTLDATAEGELFVADLFATSATQVTALHAEGRVVVAYVSVGSLERWRDDAASVPSVAIGKPLASYPDEAWLDIRDEGVRTWLGARFDRARAKGFDGVYASALGAYRADSGFALTSDHQLDFLRFLVREAHARALHVGLSGDFTLASALPIDFAIAVGCVAQKACAELTPLVMRKVPAFDLELVGNEDQACRESYGIPITFKRSDFGAYRGVCP
jgi:hypothetical protein